MTLEPGEPHRCLNDPVSYSSGSEQPVMSTVQPRALSVRTAPMLSIWDVFPWITLRSSSSPQPPVTLGSPLPYIAPSGV